MIDKDLKIGICGLGLIGGSMAKALRNKALALNIYALDKSESYLNIALSEGIVDNVSVDDYSIFSGCDIVFVCTPIDYVVDTVIEISKHTDALICDTASTKYSIISKIPSDIRFIGTHPMAGSELNGYNASNETLFENAIYIICKRESTQEADYSLLRDIVVSIGAIAIDLEPQEHDKAVSMISHLPHIVASTLVTMVANDSNSKLLKLLAAGGFKDITRIASSDNVLWQQILLSSGENLLDLLKKYRDNIDELVNIMQEGDSTLLNDYLKKAKDFRDSISTSSYGLIPSHSELYVEVSDKPGIIGTVATLLGKNRINIKNLYIENSREYEGGSLRITLERPEDSNRAVEMLNGEGFYCKAR